MFDRAPRSRVRTADSPPPGAYSPTLPGKTLRPSLAPFSTGAKRSLSATNRNMRDPSPTQYLAHEPMPIKGNASSPRSFMTTSARFADRPTSRLVMRVKDGKAIVLENEIPDVPGPGAYNVPVAVMQRPVAHSFSQAARPITAPSAPNVDDHGNLLSWGNVKRNPPSIPSTSDYGYDVAADGSIAPQKPPVGKTPRAFAPGPTSYHPDDRLSSSHRQRKSFVSFGSSKAQRSDMVAAHVDVGPGDYNIAVPTRNPSERLQTSVFASKSRKGMSAVIGRTATGSKVGPGSHFNDTTTTGFRPRKSTRVQRFGVTGARFQDHLPDIPGPGAYSTISSAQHISMAARQQALLLSKLAHVRQARESTRHKATEPSNAEMESKEDNRTAIKARDVPPVPVFFSSAPRFAYKVDEDIPAVGSYDVTHAGSKERASSAPPGKRLSAFNSTTRRFAGVERPGTGTTELVGPGSYSFDAYSDPRKQLAARRPTSSFLTPANRSLPGPDKTIGDETLLSMNLRTELAKPPMSASGKRGQFAALSASRKQDTTAEIPGPGTYDLATPALDLAKRKRAKSQTNPAIVADRNPTVMVTGAPRFYESQMPAPGPGDYDPDAAFGGRTKRTFNVSLAANEARAIIRKNLPTVAKLLG